MQRWVILETEETTAVAARTVARAARNIARGYPGDPTTSDSGGVTRERIANSIHPEKRGRMYRVVAGSGEIALTGLWEMGNTGDNENQATFRHPTFGHDPWVNQQKWPFMRMAVDQEQAGILLAYGIAVDKAFRRARL